MPQSAQNSGSPWSGWPQVLTTDQMRAAESAAIASGKVSGAELMERAGAGAARTIRRRHGEGRRALILCGPGNNGGDGFVVARHLHRAGWQLRVLFAGRTEHLSPDAGQMLHQWSALGEIRPLTLAAMRGDSFQPQVIVDAIFGTGLTRTPQGELAEVLQDLARPGAPVVVALDAPSGLDLDTGFPPAAGQTPSSSVPRAELTIAFHSIKPGHLLGDGPRHCGAVEVVDIGLQSDAATRWIDHMPANVLQKRSGHKYDHGHALVIAGGFGHGGAARLSARAALRMGAGLVTLAPPRAALIEHAGPPDALMRRGVDDAPALSAMLNDSRINAVVLGPGCGVGRAGQLLDPLLAARRPCVLDADALTALAGRGLAGLHDVCVLTPHQGEFARIFPDLAGQLSRPSQHGPSLSRLDAVRAAAASSGATVLLKGPDTVIAAPDGRAGIHSAFDVPWLATAGTGDVLAGIIAGLLARGLAPFEAAATAAWLHAAAARRFGPGLIADDLPDTLPAVFRDLGL